MNPTRIYLTRPEYVDIIAKSIADARPTLSNKNAEALRRHAETATLVARANFEQAIKWPLTGTEWQDPSNFCGCPATQAGLWPRGMRSVAEPEPGVALFAYSFDNNTYYLIDPDVDHRDVTLVEIVND